MCVSGNGELNNSSYLLILIPQDGQLKKDDLLVQINEYSVLHMPSEDVIDRLRSVSMAGQAVKLVIARTVEGEEPPEPPLEINDVRSFLHRIPSTCT